MYINAETLTKLLLREAFLSRGWVVGIAVFVMLTALVAGLAWPKKYLAGTTILVEDKNILQPLMQGAAVATEAADRARIAREVIYGRKIMNAILKEAGWLTNGITDEEREKLYEKLHDHTDVYSEGRDLIKIDYWDELPQRAFFTAKRYAEMFIAESVTAKASESQSAFDFIDNQVKEYHAKLLSAEEALKEFRSANLDVQLGNDNDVGARLSALNTQIEQTTQQLREAEIKKQSLEKQLSGESETSTVMTREGQYRTRIEELRSQMDTLLLTYRDTYPDVVRLRHQIEDLKDAITAERRRRDAAKASGRAERDDIAVNNPVFLQLKTELMQTRVLMDTLEARIAEARRELQQELERGKRVHGGTVTLAELTRDYQVNHDIYQDLVKRRENARVSMNMDRDHQGLSFKIQEPATIPVQAAGLRFIHIMGIGSFLAVLIPFGLIYLKLRLDPRIRWPGLIAEKHRVPVLATVPHSWLPMDVLAVKRDTTRLVLVSSLAAIVVIAGGILRLQGVL
ncbi:MAG: hypothetical protein HY273_04685 [Gammaproteobacteria bacterium]|nr:hypothetical protein [Gammaproteobacteria bacterium]